MAAAPFYIAPVNQSVPLEGVLAEKVAASYDDYEKFIYQDWATISKYRPEWIERFSKAVSA